MIDIASLKILGWSDELIESVTRGATTIANAAPFIDEAAMSQMAPIASGPLLATHIAVGADVAEMPVSSGTEFRINS